MKVSVTMFATDRTMRPDELAVAAEERGFYGLYLPEHTHIPSSRLTPPPTGGDTLADEYSRTLDPWVALAMAAAVTQRLVIGTGIALVMEHDPIALAKQIATLDHLSGGRVVFGIGFGWNREEAADHGVSWPTRRDLTREYVLAMRDLWSPTPVGFEGNHVTLAPSWAWPKPARRVPTLIGGAAGPTIFRHIAEYGDGWMPIGGGGMAAALPQLREAWVAAGRAPDDLQLVPFGTLADKAKMDYYASLGASEVVLRVPGGTSDEVLPELDRLMAFATT